MNAPRSDLHMHTRFCDGSASVREMVDAAWRKGFHTVGLSGHAATRFDDSYCMQDEERYFDACREAREAYRGRIAVAIGLEVDAYDAHRPRECDYVIGSAHYVMRGGAYYEVDGSPAGLAHALSDGFGGDAHKLISSYFEGLVSMARVLCPEIIGHVDLLTKFCEVGSPIDTGDGYFRDAAREAVLEIVKYAPRFEVNTGAIGRGYRTAPYPDDELISVICEAGGRLILSSDAHAPENIGFAFSEACARLTRLGVTVLDVYRGDRFVTEPILP